MKIMETIPLPGKRVCAASLNVQSRRNAHPQIPNLSRLL
jgi:hypothetical protein